MSAPAFQLRLAEPSDEPFLLELYSSTHGQQFAVVPLAPAHREALVRMQFEAQRAGYRQQFPGSQEFIIVAGDERTGRVWLAEGEAENRILDLAIVPQHQGRGIGRAVLEGVIEKAAGANKPLRLMVHRMNERAVALYRRLGFEVCGEDEVYLEMKQKPRPS